MHAKSKKELTSALKANFEAIDSRMHALAFIQKEVDSGPYGLRFKDGERRLFQYKQSSQGQKERFSSLHHYGWLKWINYGKWSRKIALELHYYPFTLTISLIIQDGKVCCAFGETQAVLFILSC